SSLAFSTPPTLVSRLLPLTSPPPPSTSPLSLHDALPIWPVPKPPGSTGEWSLDWPIEQCRAAVRGNRQTTASGLAQFSLDLSLRSEEHTSELQSRFDLVCRLLLEKKKNHTHDQQRPHTDH